jgi:phosphotransferase system IIB component
MNNETKRIIVERRNADEVDKAIKKVRVELKDEANSDEVVYEIDEGMLEFVLDDYTAWFGSDYVLVEEDE